MLDVNQLEIRYVTNKAGEKTAVILSIEEFRELMEDIEDLAAVAERREEPTIPHEQLLIELKEAGLLQD
jgi:PHD/YefM family antitoxin component YafN of YafNO toxin-antitoxin module